MSGWAQRAAENAEREQEHADYLENTYIPQLEVRIDLLVKQRDFLASSELNKAEKVWDEAIKEAVKVYTSGHMTRWVCDDAAENAMKGVVNPYAARKENAPSET